MSVFNENIVSFFQGLEQLEFEKELEPDVLDIAITTTVLMISLARQDKHFCSSQGSTLAREVSSRLSLDPENRKLLISRVSDLSRNFDKIENFVEAINSCFNELQRLLIVALIWKIATETGVADRMETSFSAVLKNRLNLSGEQSVKARLISELPATEIIKEIMAQHGKITPPKTTKKSKPKNVANLH